MEPLRSLFIAEDWPITPNARGGMSPLIHSHLKALVNCGIEVTLVTVSSEGHSKGFEDFTANQSGVWAQLRKGLSDHKTITARAISKKKSPCKALKATLRHFPGYQFIPDTGTRQLLADVVADANPDYIWAEDILAAVLIVQIDHHRPVIYSHNDWKWRIKQHRGGSNLSDWRKSLKYWIRRRQEERLVREVTGCVAASASEAEEIKALGIKNILYFPTVYSPRLKGYNQTEGFYPRLVHLGGMQTTANRIGLTRFLEVAWPIICRTMSAPPELWIVGSLSGASEKLKILLQEVGAVCTGYVEELGTVLRANDLQIVPWEYNTGTRTRIPLAMNYGQVIVSTRAAAACLPELQHDRNCVLTYDLAQMGDEIIALCSDYDRRQRLSCAGHETFLQNFTVEAIQPRLEQFLSSVLETPVWQK